MAKADAQDASVEPAGGSKRSIVRRISDSVDYGLTWFFRAEGRLMARRPWAVIITCLVVTGLCMIGFVNFTIEQDADVLYTPNDAESIEYKKYVEATYGTRQDATFQLYGLDKVVKNGNVLTKDLLLEHLRGWKLIEATTATSGGKTYVFSESCIKVSPTSSECKVDSVLRFWGYDEERLRADPDILRTINNASLAVNYDGRRIPMDWVLGGVVRDASGRIISAEVLQTVFFMAYNPVRKDGATEDKVYDAWCKAIVKVAYTDWKSPILKSYVQSDGAVGQESADAINADVMLLTVGYILLIAYTFIALWRNSKAYNKTHMTLAGLLSIGCGIACAFGILSGVGVDFNFVCQVLPFLLVGIGSDNVFVIISTYFQQDPDSPVEVRIGNVMASAGSSLSVTSITNLIAFAVNTATNLDALYAFALYASISILFIYIYQVTLFPALLALEARREMRSRQRGGEVHAVACCCGTDDYADSYVNGMNGWQAEQSSGSGSSKRYATQDTAMELAASPNQDSMKRPPSMHAAVSNITDVESNVAAYPVATNPAALAAPGSKDVSAPGYCGTGAFDPHADTLATKIVARWLPKLTLNPWGKGVVLLLEALYIAAAIYGCTQVYMDFGFREMFVPDSSWLQGAFTIQKEYFYGDSSPVGAYTKEAPVGQHYFDYQNELAQLSANMRANPYIAAEPKFTSWYDDYSAWLAAPANPHSAALVAGRAANVADFVSFLKEYLAGPGKVYEDDIIFAADGIAIVGSRMLGFTVDIKDGSFAINMLDSTQKTAEQSAPSLDAFAYGPSSTFYEGFKSITWSTIFNVITSACAVFVVVLLLLGNITSSLLVLLMVVLCDVGVFGMMHYAGLTFNIVTCIVIVMAVGLAVDYSAHIMRAYLVSPGTYQERAHAALVDIGGAVWNGILTTFLAIIVMAGAQHYIFSSIFKMFVFLIWTSAWHGLVLLPVLLSFYGPASYSGSSASSKAHATATASHAV